MRRSTLRRSRSIISRSESRVRYAFAAMKERGMLHLCIRNASSNPAMRLMLRNLDSARGIELAGPFRVRRAGALRWGFAKRCVPYARGALRSGCPDFDGDHGSDLPHDS
ncbi:hypothetical protein [Aquamicrobium terrae]